ncbi:glycogen synthase [Candidatus Microgenomates bacterium]|nr:glycogen synthase [Candidatus Microgenomates bacterium]
MQTMRVLITGYEAAPFFKRGGLGDVLGSLPKALRKIGVDVRVIIPYYQDIEKKYKFPKIGEYAIVFGSDIEQIGVYEGGDVYFLSNRKYLNSINTRGRNKKIDQFAFFDLAVVEFSSFILEKKKWYPNIIHCNDWHTGLIPLLIEQRIPTLLTIHNLNYQGRGSGRVLDLLHVKDEKVKELKRGTPATEINVLGEGIIHATRVSTVSPTYAREITNSYDHDPIHAFLKRREEEKGKKDDVLGILNGIDYAAWNSNYDVVSWESRKKKNKEALLKSVGLTDRPTFCFIGRMARQKGLDILVRAIDKILSKDKNAANFIVLGSGIPTIEKMVKKTASAYKDNVRVELSYNDELAHKLYAGSDFIIIPSRYEPCGLIQMIAMRYATLPIASKTGGLKDTISHGKNGFLFGKESVSGLVVGVRKALAVFNNYPHYEKMVKFALQTDFSWNRSAKLYKKLYIDITRE